MPSQRIDTPTAVPCPCGRRKVRDRSGRLRCRPCDAARWEARKAGAAVCPAPGCGAARQRLSAGGRWWCKACHDRRRDERRRRMEGRSCAPCRDCGGSTTVGHDGRTYCVRCARAAREAREAVTPQEVEAAREAIRREALAALMRPDRWLMAPAQPASQIEWTRIVRDGRMSARNLRRRLAERQKGAQRCA